MSPWLPYTFRNLARRRTRTALGIAGIFLTVALLTTIQVGIDSISVSYLDLVALQAGRADIIIRAPGGDLTHPQAFEAADATREIAKSSDIAGISPRVIGIIQAQYRGAEQYAVLIGVDPGLEAKHNLWGVEPPPSLEPGACALSQALAAKLGIAIGGTVFVKNAAGYTDSELRVASTVSRQLILPQEVKDFIVVTLAAGRKVLDEPERVHVLAGALRDPHQYYDARDLHGSVLKLKAAGQRIAERLGPAYEVHLPKAEAITAFRNFTSPLRAIFGVFALLALLITGLLIYSLVSVGVEERIREYAILRALGTRRQGVFLLVLFEALVLCVTGVLPGVLAGVVLARALTFLLSLAFGAPNAIALEVSASTVGWALVGGVLISIGSALVPGLQATRRPIVDGLDPLRGGQVQKPREDRLHPALPIAGLVLSSISVVVFFVLPSAVLSGNPSLIGTVLLCLLISILVGFTLGSLGLLPFLQNGLARLSASFSGPGGELAARNLKRYRRRHVTTSLLFTLSVALVIFVASLVALSSRTALAVVAQTHGADIRIQSFSGAYESLRDELGRVEGVKGVSEARFLRSRTEMGTAYDVVIRDVVGMKQLWVVPFGVDPDLVNVLYTNQIAWSEGGAQALGGLNAGGNADTNVVGNIILSLAVARYLDAVVGDLVDLSFKLGPEQKEGRFRVTGICSGMPGFPNFRGRVAAAVGSGVMISARAFNKMTAAAPGDAVLGLYFVQCQPGDKSQKAVASTIRDRFDVRYRFGVQSTVEQKEQARVMYWATQVFFSMLLAVAVMIAVFSLVASMTSTVLERRRETGILKAIGMRRGELFRLFLTEAAALTLSSGFAGGVIGFLLAFMFVAQAAALMELAVVFTMPWLTFLAMVAISLFAAAVSAYWPTRRLLKLTAAEILRG